MADSTETRALLLQINATTEVLRAQLSAAEKAAGSFAAATQAHLDKVDDRFDLLGKSVEKLEAPLERLKQLGEVAIGAVLGESLLEAGKKSLEFAGNVKFVSEQVGTSTDFLQKYRFAAGQFGVGTAEADEGLNKFARSIGEAANGNKTIIKLFSDLGVNVRDAGGKVRTVQAVFLDTATAISKLDNPAQKSADTLALMGKSAAGLVPLLSAGAGGFDTLAASAEQLGVVLSPELIEHSEQVNHHLAALKNVLDAQLASAIDSNAGAIEGLATALVKLAGAFAKLNDQHPGTSLGIVGAMAGYKIGGLPGAVAGGVGGLLEGRHLKQEEDDNNTDPSFRRQQLFGARDKLAADVRNRANSGGSLVANDDYKNDIDAVRTQLARYKASLKTPHDAEGGLGSSAAGTTNDNGDDLKTAQAQLSKLEQLRANATGDALKGINEEIVQQKRKIAFIKQGADAELAGSLAAKQNAAQRSGESAAKSAARKAEEIRQKNLTDDIAYAGEVRKLREQLLDGMRKTASTEAARDDLQKEGIRSDADLAKQQNQLRLAKGDLGSDPKVAQARLDTLNGLVDQVRDQKLQNVDVARASANIQQQADLQQEALQTQIALGQYQDQMATTAKARRDIELRLLTYQEQQERLAQQRIIDDPSKSDDDKAKARAALGDVDQLHDSRVASIEANTRGPQEQFLHDINSKDINESLQSVKVDGLGSLENGFDGILDGTKSVSSAFHDMAQSIISDLVRIDVEQEIIKPLANALFGGSGASSGASSGAGLLGFIGKIFGHADGGHITGPGTGRSDSILARLSNGEFVVNAEATKKNIALLHAINDNRMPHFADGGLVAPTVAIAPTIPNLQKIGEARAQSLRITVVGETNNDVFNARVAGISGGQIGAAAPHIAASGSTLARSDAARAGRRRLGVG